MKHVLTKRNAQVIIRNVKLSPSLNKSEHQITSSFLLMWTHIWNQPLSFKKTFSTLCVEFFVPIFTMKWSIFSAFSRTSVYVNIYFLQSFRFWKEWIVSHSHDDRHDHQDSIRPFHFHGKLKLFFFTRSLMMSFLNLTGIPSIELKKVHAWEFGRIYLEKEDIFWKKVAQVDFKKKQGSLWMRWWIGDDPDASMMMMIADDNVMMGKCGGGHDIFFPFFSCYVCV